jgi:hypothetical protein
LPWACFIFSVMTCLKNVRNTLNSARTYILNCDRRRRGWRECVTQGGQGWLLAARLVRNV